MTEPEDSIAHEGAPTPDPGTEVRFLPGSPPRLIAETRAHRLTMLGECRGQGGVIGPGPVLAEFEGKGMRALGEYSGDFTLHIEPKDGTSSTLVQGPLGHRAVYWTWNRGLVWGTDLEGVAGPSAPRHFDDEAFREALNWRWCIGSRSLIRGVQQLMPATATTVGPDGLPSERHFPDLSWDQHPDRPMEEWTDSLVDVLREGLADALSSSSHPVVLLSGGVDSALLLAIARELRSDIVALTPSFERHADPELGRARRVASKLGVQHQVLELSDREWTAGAKDFVGTLGVLPRDFWAITLLVALRHEAVQADVVIHGHGADTVLSGIWWDRVVRRDRWIRLFHSLVPNAVRKRIMGRLPLDESRLGDLRDLLEYPPEHALTTSNTVWVDRALRRRFQDAFGQPQPPRSLVDRYWPEGETKYKCLRRMGFHRTLRANLIELTGLADAVGIQFRYPFLEDGAIELTTGLPGHRRVDAQGVSKPIARKAYARFLPEPWAMQPKLGFATPGRAMIEGPLKSWFHERLGPGTAAEWCLGGGVKEFSFPRDYQVLWTLACLDEFRRVYQVEMS